MKLKISILLVILFMSGILVALEKFSNEAKKYESVCLDVITENIINGKPLSKKEIFTSALALVNKRISQRLHVPNRNEIAIEAYLALRELMHSSEISLTTKDMEYLESQLELLGMYGEFYFRTNSSHIEQLEDLREYGFTLQKLYRTSDNPSDYVIRSIDDIYNKSLQLTLSERKKSRREYERNSFQGMENYKAFISLNEADKKFISRYVMKRCIDELNYTKSLTGNFTVNIPFSEKEILDAINSIPKDQLSNKHKSFLDELTSILDNGKDDLVSNEKWIVIHDGFKNIESKYPFLTEIYLNRREGVSMSMLYINKENVLAFLATELQRAFVKDSSPSNMKRLSISYLEKILIILQKEIELKCEIETEVQK